MARKKRRKKKKLHRRGTPSPEQSTNVYISQYEITFEPLPDPVYDSLPKSVKNRLEEIHEGIQRKPEAFISELLELKATYPDVPQIYNHLSVAYSLAGDEEKAEAITLENLQKNPDYLFARINMAQFFMARGEYDQVPKLFDNKFDLKLLYPKRDVFHISEVANFMGIIGLYFVGIGQREAASKYLEILEELAPDFPVTQKLRRVLYPSLLTKLFR